MPTLSAGVPDFPLQSPLQPMAPAQAKPPPEPEPFFARWEKKMDARAAGAPRTDAAPDLGTEGDKAPAVPALRPPPPAAGSGARTARPARGAGRVYTVQIGAFKSDRAARAYLAQHNLEAIPDLVVQPEPQGPQHYVLVTFGKFETVKAALAAWRSSGAPGDLDIWVREISPVPVSSEAAVAPGASSVP